MVKKSGNFYVCEECRLRYREKSWAEKCEKWCSKYKSCNLEIIKHAENGRENCPDKVRKDKDSRCHNEKTIETFILGGF